MKLKSQFVNLFRATNKLAESERKSIEQFLDLEPRFLQNEVAYRNNLISLTTTLAQLQNNFTARANDLTVTREEANLNRDKAAEITGLQRLLKAPLVILTPEDVQKATKLPLGSEIIVWDAKKGIYEAVPIEQFRSPGK